MTAAAQATADVAAMTTAAGHLNTANTLVESSALSTTGKLTVHRPLARAVGILENIIAATTAWLDGAMLYPNSQITADRVEMQDAMVVINDANMLLAASSLNAAERAPIHSPMAAAVGGLKTQVASAETWLSGNPVTPPAPPLPPTPPPPLPPTPPPPPAPSVGPSGIAMPSGDITNPDGSRWIQRLGDDFSTWTCALPNFPSGTNLKIPPNSAPGFKNWTSYRHVDSDDYHDTSGNGLYMSNACISVNTVQYPRLLNIYMHTDPATKRPFVATPIPILGGPGPEGGFQYLRTAICFRVDPSLASMLPGYKIAHLFWPDSEQWPQGGEIDGAECDLNGNISFYWHWADGGGNNQQYYITTSVPVADGNFHTVIKEWTPSGIAVWVDGTEYFWNYGSDTGNEAAIISHLPPGPMTVRIQNETNLDEDDGNPAYPDPSVEGNIQLAWFVASSYEAA